MTLIHAQTAPVSSTQEPGPRTSVMAALHAASERTGVSFDYLLRTAQRESGLESGAKASTSSASGLFQFIDQTWLGMVARHGDKHGLETESAAITQTAQGRYEIADPAAREAILALRFDPAVASVMAAEYTRESADRLESRLGRAPSEGELYVAHFLGANGAARLIEAGEADPNTSAATLFPRAAEANTAIFYGKSGAERSVGEVLAVLKRETPGPDTPQPVYAQAAPMRSVHSAPAMTSPSRAYLLSPGMIEILASLDPLRATDRETILKG